MILTGAEIIAEVLLEQQVDTVFGYPGGAVLNTYDALYKYRDRIHHTMNCLCEAIGIALPGNGTIPAISNKRTLLAKHGKRTGCEPA